jgi:hypothetical protein
VHFLLVYGLKIILKTKFYIFQEKNPQMNPQKNVLQALFLAETPYTFEAAYMK